MPTPNHTIVRAYLNAYNRADWDTLEALLQPDYVHHNNGQALDVAQFRRGAEWFRAGFPDFAITAVSTVAEGDRIAVRWVAAGTHSFALMGEEPTGRTVTLHGITQYRIKDGLVAEDWEAMDEADLMRQISPTDAG